MYKSLLAASLAAIVALFLAYTQLPTDLGISLSDYLKRTRAYSNMSSTQVSRSVVKKVLSIETPEVSMSSYSWMLNADCDQGDGALVRRSIGSEKLRNLTPFLMLDHFHVAKGAVCCYVI